MHSKWSRPDSISTIAEELCLFNCHLETRVYAGLFVLFGSRIIHSFLNECVFEWTENSLTKIKEQTQTKKQDILAICVLAFVDQFSYTCSIIDQKF